MTKMKIDYPENYTGPANISLQIQGIAKKFNLDPAHALEYAKNLPPLPKEADGWFAFPKISALVKTHFPTITDPHQQYCEAVKLASRKAYLETHDLGEEQSDIFIPTRLRQIAHTIKCLRQLEEKSPGDIIIIAAQYGRLHKDHSVVEARKICLKRKNEFGLGIFHGIIMSISHEYDTKLRWRYKKWSSMNTCPGDSFSLKGVGGKFTHTFVIGPDDDDSIFRAEPWLAKKKNQWYWPITAFL